MYARPLVLFGLKFCFGLFSTSSHRCMCQVQTPGLVAATSLVGRAEVEGGTWASGWASRLLESVIPLAVEGSIQILGTSA